VLTALIGLAWAAWWKISYVPPDSITAQTVAPAHSVGATIFSWTQLIGMRETWGIVAAKFLSDAAWFFYLFWLPKYLYDARGFDIKSVGTFAWMPSAAAGLGCLLGGGFSSFLVRRKFSVNVARKLALGLSVAVMPLAILIPHVAIPWVIALFCLAYFGQQSWSTLVMVLPADLFPSEVVGSVAGLVGFGGAMGGILFGELVGYLLDRNFGYRAVFNIAGTLHIAAFLIILAALPTLLPVMERQQVAANRI